MEEIFKVYVIEDFLTEKSKISLKLCFSLFLCGAFQFATIGKSEMKNPSCVYYVMRKTNNGKRQEYFVCRLNIVVKKLPIIKQKLLN